MADPRFFRRAGPFTLQQLAELTGAELSPGADPALLLNDVAALDAAGEGQVSFLDNKKYVEAFSRSRASACLVHPSMAPRAPAGMALLLSGDPYRAYAMVAQAFYPVPPVEASIAPNAYVDSSAKLSQPVQVDPGAYVGPNAEIGAGTRIGPNAVIGEGVVLGENCTIGANASVSHALVGNRVSIYAGVRIGQDGFGFAMGPKGHLKVPQLGRVVIEDDVEIGANATIDRGAGPDTVIGAGSKIDNLVQIAHNVRLGRGCVIVSQVGISGSTKLGDFVVAAGQAGITGHLTIGSGAQIAAQSGVMRDIGPGEKVGGSPATPITEWLRQSALLAKMARKKSS
jgi:UDP-3-O-[3-hydroxymyristoyl] glucosamine N-acyltransferase